MRPILPFAIASLLILAACGGGSGPPATPTYEELARQAAQGSLVSAEDLPPGWMPSSASGGPLEQANFDLSERCDILSAEKAFLGAAATSQSGTLDGPQGRQVRTAAGVYVSLAGAKASVQSIKDTVSQCRDQYLAALKRLAQRRLDDVGIAGRVLTVVIYSGFGDPNEDEERAVVAAALSKMRPADASLPAEPTGPASH